MATPRLYRIIVPVHDMDVAVGFYGAVLGLPGERVSPGRHYFDCGGTILACYHPASDGDPGMASPLPDHLYLAVDDLEATRAAIPAAGGRLTEGDFPGGPAADIVRRPWGETSFYAVDPSGNQLCFVARGTEFTGG